MKVPFSWLKDLISIEIPITDLSERLSVAGFELESLENCSQQVQGVVIGFITKKEPHPNADKLSICNVLVEDNTELQIVCGASNVRKGIHVPVAIVGTNLSIKNIQIKESEIRGIKSQGMICSFEELGLEEKSKGIAILDEYKNKTPKIGESLAKFLDIDDYIFEFAITANRPDGLSVIGIAREVKALLDRNLNIPNIQTKSNYSELLNKEIVLNKGEFYGITKITNLDNNKQLPEKFIKRIKYCGINSVNPIVDLTNYVMLEQGQPLHAFDADKLCSIIGKEPTEKSFGVRYSHKGESLIALDNKKYLLNDQCRVITCENKIIAIAGIIGGKDCSVDHNTSNIWLEHALFVPKDIRITSRVIGLRTESSTRYEKGLIKEITILSAERLCDLIHKYNNGNVISSWQSFISDNEQERVFLRKDRIRRILGPMNKKYINNFKKEKQEINSLEHYLTDDIIEDKLTAIGCNLRTDINGWYISPPSSRKLDLTREIDFIEEIARLVGYDNFSSTLPRPISPGVLNDLQKAEQMIGISLCNNGLQEVVTMSLVGSEQKPKSRIPISNPLLKETSHLRTNLWEEHIKICQRNLKTKQPGCWIYEKGNIYLKVNDNIIETSLIGGLISGERRLGRWDTSGRIKHLNFYEARGVLEQALLYLKLNLIYKSYNDNELLHPGRSSQIYLEGKIVGFFGELHPTKSEYYELPKQTYIYELDLKSILVASTRKNKWLPAYKEYPKVPTLERDLTIIIKNNISSQDLISTIRKLGRPLLEDIELLDMYRGESITKGSKSLTFRFKYRGKSTLSENEIIPIHDKIREGIKRKYSAELKS